MYQGRSAQDMAANSKLAAYSLIGLAATMFLLMLVEKLSPIVVAATP